MQSDKSLKTFTPPSIDGFLQEKYWAIHEAAFVLTKWPEYNLFKTNFEQSLESKVNLERSFLYLPENLKIDPKKYGKEFEIIFNHLKQAVEDLELNFQMHFVRGSVYFIKPLDIIIWTLTKGYKLPIELQEAIGIYQDFRDLQLHSKTRTLLPKKVQQKIIAQRLLASSPNLERTLLCKIIKNYFGLKGSDLTAIRKCINELYNSPGKKGRRKIKENTTESYVKKPIAEIVTIDSKGNFYFNFFLLTEAMVNLAYFKVITMQKEKILRIEKQQFIEDFMTDEVVSLYTQDNLHVLLIIFLSALSAWNNLMKIRGQVENGRVTLFEESRAVVN